MADERVEGEAPEDKLSPQGIETTIDLSGTPPAQKPAQQQEMFPEVEVIDDTPPRDRGHTRPTDDMSSPTEKELKDYSEFKKRVDELTYRYHDQRRVAEAREREAAAAAQHLKDMLEENRRLKEMATLAGGAFKTAATSSAEARMEAAKRAYASAYEAGDPVKQAEANQELASAAYHLEEAKRYEAPKFEETQAPQHPQQQQVDPRVIEANVKTEQWLRQNQWFQQPGNDMMKVVARSIHEMLVRQEGIMPNTDDYYRRVDAGLREVFPQYKWEGETEKPNGNGSSRTAQVVAPTGRTPPAQGNQPGKVRLTESQVKLAARLGLTPQQYAMQLVKDSAQGS